MDFPAGHFAAEYGGLCQSETLPVVARQGIYFESEQVNGMSTTMPRKKDKAVHCHIRWMIRRDMPSILEIENLSYSENGAWKEEQFIQHLRQRDNIGMVAEIDDQIVGFMVYQLHKTRLNVINFAVHPAYRRIGVGRSMINKLISKLSWQRRDRIQFDVFDDRLETHLFLKACGLRAEGIGCCEETEQEFYHFIYRAPKES